MRLNGLGRIVEEEILRTTILRKNVSVDSWVIVPNHLHLILNLIDEPFLEMPRRGVSTEKIKSWKPTCLGSIINHLKGACTRRIRNSFSPNFAWQARFYDHIIRTEQDLENARQFIYSNPLIWQDNQYNSLHAEVITHA